MIQPITWTEESERSWRGTTEDDYLIFVVLSELMKIWEWIVYLPEGNRYHRERAYRCTNDTSKDAKYCANLAVNAHRLIEVDRELFADNTISEEEIERLEEKADDPSHALELLRGRADGMGECITCGIIVYSDDAEDQFNKHENNCPIGQLEQECDALKKVRDKVLGELANTWNAVGMLGKRDWTAKHILSSMEAPEKEDPQ